MNKLIKAIKDGNLKIIEEKIDEDPTCINNVIDKGENTLLWLATKYNQHKIIEYLIEEYADTSAINSDNDNAICFANVDYIYKNETPLIIDVKYRDHIVVDIIKAGVNLNDKLTKTALDLAKGQSLKLIRRQFAHLSKLRKQTNAFHLWEALNQRRRIHHCII